MCGIVGLFLKDLSLKPDLGQHLAAMLDVMCDRGPDSAGFAVYTDERPELIKLTVRAAARTASASALADRLGRRNRHNGRCRRITARTRVFLRARSGMSSRARALIASDPDFVIVGTGRIDGDLQGRRLAARRVGDIRPRRPCPARTASAIPAWRRNRRSPSTARTPIRPGWTNASCIMARSPTTMTGGAG